MATENVLFERRQGEIVHPRLDVLLRHGWSVVLFDESCELCARFVGFAGRRSLRARLAFCAVQSAPGQSAARHFDVAALTAPDRFGVVDKTGSGFGPMP